MYYDDSRDPRLGLSSVVLLAIFVSAFVLIVAAAVWRPWAEDDEVPAPGIPEVNVEEPAAVPAADAEVGAEPPAP
jgi:hypothetical protein